MILGNYIKQPVEVKDYVVDYTPWLEPMNDTISDATADIVCITDPTDTSLKCNAVFLSPMKVKCWISGGTTGQKYKITITTTTNGGRVDQSELLFVIKDF